MKKINLFRTKPKIPRLPFLTHLSAGGKKVATALSMIFFMIFLLINYRIFIIKKEYSQKETAKEQYLKFLLENKEIEAKFGYFKAKQKQLSDYYGDDAFFLPYYQVLINALKPASDSAIIESITIDSKRSSTFLIKILDFDQAISFLKYAESEEFLKNFDELILTGFNLYQSDSQDNIYQFNFRGSFKTINEPL